MYYITYKTDTGELVGVSPEDPPSIEGFTKLSYGDSVPNLDNLIWDKNQTKFVSDPRNPVITKLQFLSRFTMQERLAIRASTDPVVQDIMNLLNLATEVNVTDQQTMMGVGYLAMVGLIDNLRVAEILA